ncbi:hypothetical protein B0H13DRAFT_2365092 [Mycena leptocephala]|nr:hypothetical protein B0H13DRAFT_2365092 [Mycena leptocephala]
MTTAPPSPLSMMDPVEAFSRMGVQDLSADEPPIKQWGRCHRIRYYCTLAANAPHGIEKYQEIACVCSGQGVYGKVFNVQYLDDEYLHDE